MDIDIIFKIAAIGIAIAVLNQVLIKAGREEQAMMTTLAGVIVVLMLIIQMITEFFDTVRTFLEFLGELMEILKIVAIALTGVILAALMKNLNKEMSIYIILATVIILFISIIDELWEAFRFLEGIYDNVTYGKAFFPVILKVLAVAYITDFTAQLCKDSGEGAIGAKVELAGKVIIFYLAIPILTAVLELVGSLLT